MDEITKVGESKAREALSAGLGAGGADQDMRGAKVIGNGAKHLGIHQIETTKAGRLAVKLEGAPFGNWDRLWKTIQVVMCEAVKGDSDLAQIRRARDLSRSRGRLGNRG